MEQAIKHFLKTGKTSALAKRNLTKSADKEVLKGLALDLTVINYTNDSETKTFLVREAKKKDADFRERSGARYRLNRWREIPGSALSEAIAAWNELKTRKVPKTFAGWKRISK